MRSVKLVYCSKTIWRKIFLQQESTTLRGAEQFVSSRSSTVPSFFRREKMKIYSGKKWHIKIINRWMAGFKFGSFTWTRKIAIFKSKQLKKQKIKEQKKLKQMQQRSQKSKIKINKKKN